MNDTDKTIKNPLPPTTLKKSDFFYELPPHLIAQTPAIRRDMSRLMVLDKLSGEVSHRRFCDITEYLFPGDVLVLNETRVIPARLIGKKADTGIEIETLLLKDHGNNVWETITRPARRTKTGTDIIFGDGALCASVTDILSDGRRLVKFTYEGSFYETLDRVGLIPLPPYITERGEEKTRYQTVYAKVNGSAAAPTAGLHFTPELLGELTAKGIKIAPVTLHVGLGTFRPVKEDAIAEHTMHTEYMEMPQLSADIINNRTGRVVAVGTTSCRTLESAADENGKVRPCSGETGIFIYPGYKFRATDALITNFHLPESTLLMLVSALSSREIVLDAYEKAISENYRFFSYGDAMFLH